MKKSIKLSDFSIEEIKSSIEERFDKCQRIQLDKVYCAKHFNPKRFVKDINLFNSHSRDVTCSGLTIANSLTIDFKTFFIEYICLDNTKYANKVIIVKNKVLTTIQLPNYFELDLSTRKIRYNLNNKIDKLEKTIKKFKQQLLLEKDSEIILSTERILMTMNNDLNDFIKFNELYFEDIELFAREYNFKIV